jgi:acetoin utilization deacetylase AcuC-like enzyme
MIFYHPDCDLRFSDYGIEIPIEDDRAKKVFEYLKSHYPNLNYTDLNSLAQISRQDLLLVHKKEYVDKLYGNVSELEAAMLSAYELVNEKGDYHRYNPASARCDFNHALKTILAQTAMTYESSKAALKNGFSYYLGGGMHHAMSFSGRGFCVINDIAIAIAKMQKENLIKHAWVVDVDAHKGDGTAEIFKDNENVSTLSLHMQKGWPLNMGSESDPWFIASNIDIGIKSGEEETYLVRLLAGLLSLENTRPWPDLVIIVNGADPFEADELESAKELKLSKETMLERDMMLYNFFKDSHIPQSYVMAGGYGKRSWEIYAQFLEFVGKNSPEGTIVSSR